MSEKSSEKSKGNQELPVKVVLQSDSNLVVNKTAIFNSVIRSQIESTSFCAYKAFMDAAMGELIGSSIQNRDNLINRILSSANPPRVVPKGCHRLHGALAYDTLRLATEAFLLSRCGPLCADFDVPKALEDNVEVDAARLKIDAKTYRKRVKDYLGGSDSKAGSPLGTPYLDSIVAQLLAHLPAGSDVSHYASRYECPEMIELIWSYWHEEGMLSNSLSAVAIRFQNRKRPGGGPDPLASFELDPLRPLGGLLWGWIQSEYQRVPIERRSHEYDHHYGFVLKGSAIPSLPSADSRTNFIPAFHRLLKTAHDYFEDRKDKTKIADGFALLNALRDTHNVLAEGAHNQYGELPWAARVEMLIEQWLMARPEMHEFLRGRAMVPYAEPWMSQVDTMKKQQDWTDVSVSHFHELAACGEAIVLTVRHGPWANSNDESDATNWADFWRPEIRRYIDAYKAATDCDLTQTPVSDRGEVPPQLRMPSELLHERLMRQRARQRVAGWR
jgi:hypothetical protein